MTYGTKWSFGKCGVICADHGVWGARGDPLPARGVRVRWVLPPENWLSSLHHAIYKSLGNAVLSSVYKEAIMAKSTKVDRSVLASRETIQATLNILKRDAEDAKRRASNLRKARFVTIQPVLTRLHMLIDSIPERDRNVSLAMHFSRPEVTVSLYNQDSLKSDVVCELLAYASDICPNAKSRDFVGKDWGERDHTFYNDDLYIRIAVSVKTDGSACKRVLVGTKTVVQDEYKFVCEE